MQEVASSSLVAPPFFRAKIPAIWLVLSTGEQTPETPHASSRKRWEERRRHLRREFLEHTHGPRDVTIAKMDHAEMEDGEAPSRHDLDEPPVAQQFRLHQRPMVEQILGCFGRVALC